MRYALRGVHFSSDKKKINRIYLARNPWDLDAPSQHYRFKETNRIIKSRIGDVDKMLEIGCGEGHQSCYLTEVCGRLVGVDVSSRAVTRAKKKCPGAKYIVGDIFSNQIDKDAPFDLVAACEVLYYMNDITGALHRIRSLGRKFIITYYSGQMRQLDPIVLSLSKVSTELIGYHDIQWRIVWGDGE